MWLKKRIKIFMEQNPYKTVAYRLRLSLPHLKSLPDPTEREYGEVEDYDVLIYEPNKPEEVDDSFLERIIPYNGPEYLDWLGFLDRLLQVDFLRGDLLWPLMSKRMLYILCSVGNFPHKAIPLRIFDYDLRNEVNQYLNQENLSSEICNKNFIALQLLEDTDAIDFERSGYEEPIPDSIIAPAINRLILREPPEGFPPIFRLAKEYFPYLHVSLKAKQALEDSGIRGLEFIPEEGITAQEIGTIS
jgi:hypothetical protein